MEHNALLERYFSTRKVLPARDEGVSFCIPWVQKKATLFEKHLDGNKTAEKTNPMVKHRRSERVD